MDNEPETVPEPEIKPSKIDESLDEISTEYEDYLQADFQETIVRDIFEEMVEYIRFQALPICEHITFDDVNDLIELIGQFS